MGTRDARLELSTDGVSGGSAPASVEGVQGMSGHPLEKLPVAACSDERNHVPGGVVGAPRRSRAWDVYVRNALQVDTMWRHLDGSIYRTGSGRGRPDS